jgi:hypothetical protein
MIQTPWLKYVQGTMETLNEGVTNSACKGLEGSYAHHYTINAAYLQRCERSL